MGGGNMINNDGDESNDIFPSEKTVFVDDDKLLETFKPSPLLSSYNDMIRPLSDAVHTLLCMNVIKEGITLPTIVVLGDQSSGKTSVIESLTGISLPRGVCTRVPLIISLQHHSDPSFISKLHLEYKGKSVPVNEDQILEEISLATDEIAGNGKDVSDVSLTLVVKNSNVPDLTIIDLPGIPVHDKSSNIYRKISGIIEKYISSEETLILNVMSSTNDFLTCESIKMSNKYDKTGERTLHVFTKSDKASEDMVAILTNTGSDYVCVRNNFDDETYKEARINEASLFKTHHLLSNLHKSIVGIHALAQKLVLIQLASISKCSHEIVKDINEDLKMCVVQQNKQQQPFPTISVAMPAILEIINVSQKSLYKILVLREYDYYQEDTQMHCHTHLVEMLNDFAKQLKNNHLNGYEQFLGDEIQLLEERKTLCREQVFSLLLQRKIDNIYVITDSFVSRVWDYIESVILKVLVSHAQNYPQLTQSVKKAAKNVIANTKECYRGKVFEFTKIKNMEGFTRDSRVISSLNKLKESHDRVFEAMKFNYDQRVELLNVSVRVSHLKSRPKNIVSEAFDIKVRMVALLETVIRMFIGFVESHLHLMLCGMAENDMEAKLVNELRSDGENRYKPLPKESPLITTKQWKLKHRIALLEKFKKVVEETMDKITFHDY